MTGAQFEEPVAGLCRRDGFTEVRRVGGAGDNGADVVPLPRLPHSGDPVQALHHQEPDPAARDA
ncbi:restriction endonuclease [Embleya sp. NPDC050493]|uniref:restriction endonuclease n=1 Tax=Embleya sp. NPDC050493 TaxID=3363989 RepID=UPI0037A6F4E0